MLRTPPWKKGVTRGHRKLEMQTARQGKDCPAGAGWRGGEEPRVRSRAQPISRRRNRIPPGGEVTF